LAAVRCGAHARSVTDLESLGVESWDGRFAKFALAGYSAVNVLTGGLSELPRSMQWLTECIGNWKAAEAEPDAVSALFEKAISNGWVVRAEMSIEQPDSVWIMGKQCGLVEVRDLQVNPGTGAWDSQPANLGPLDLAAVGHF
ncbi:unnamed protein product, partial [Effrenium voratum]